MWKSNSSILGNLEHYFSHLRSHIYYFPSYTHIHETIQKKKKILSFDDTSTNNKPLESINIFDEWRVDVRLYASGFCQSQNRVNNKPLGPIIISSQSRVGVKLCKWLLPTS